MIKAPAGQKQDDVDAPTWSDQDLVLLGAHTQEGDIILGVHLPDHAAGLYHQLVDQPDILNRARVVQSRPDGDS